VVEIPGTLYSAGVSSLLWIKSAGGDISPYILERYLSKRSKIS